MPEANLTGMIVLLADDVAYSRAIVVPMLKDFGAREVVQAANGLEAVPFLKEGVDLVISDFNMPEMNGLDLLKGVRSGQFNTKRSIPFALLTAYSDRYLVDVAVALDVNAFLLKPVSKRGLNDRLEQLLRQVKPPNWLKPPDAYRRIDIPAPPDAEPEKVEKEDEPEAEAKRKSASVVLDLPKNRPFRRPAPEPPRAERPVGRSFGQGRSCSVHEIPENALLTRDVCDNDGRVLLRAGERLSEYFIALLVDLNATGTLAEDVWIEASEAS
jgi:CheY-like chemotaxis protein